MNKDQINAKWLAAHDALGKQKDAPDKGVFDVLHRSIWHDYNLELKARLATLEAKATLTDKELEELDALESMVL